MKRTVLLTGLLCTLLIASAAQARSRDGDLERIRIEGYVESIRGQIAYIEDDCGELYRVHLGPAWYWEDQGYRLRSGIYVTIIAWQDRYDDYCYAGEIRGRNFTYDLCDSYGFPRWSDRDYCERDWRPTRSFFNIHFVIGGQFWHCHRPYYFHYRPWYAGCYDRHDWHRHWRSGHHGRDDDRGRDRGRDDDRGGRRDNNGGGGYNYGDNDNRKDTPAGGGFNVQIEKPRYIEKSPRKDNDRRSFSTRVEKPRTVEKAPSKVSSRSSKSATKSSRKETTSTKKTWARK